MEIDNNEDKNTEENNTNQSSSLISGIFGNDILQIPIEAGKKIADTINKNAEKINESLPENILGDITEILNNTKDSICDYSGEILKEAAKTTGEITGNIADTLANNIGDIDL